MNLRKGVSESPAGKLGCQTTQSARVQDVTHERVDTSFDGASIRHGKITVPKKFEDVPVSIGHAGSFSRGIHFIPPHIAPDQEFAITMSTIRSYLEAHGIDPGNIHDVIRIPLIIAVGTLKF